MSCTMLLLRLKIKISIDIAYEPLNKMINRFEICMLTCFCFIYSLEILTFATEQKKKFRKDENKQGTSAEIM